MIEKLKDYKELITIIVFFLGGFIWLNNQFPTKNDLTDEVGSINCLVEKYMTLTQLQIRCQELLKQTQVMADKIADMENNNENVPLSPAMEFELDQLKSDFKNDREKYRDNKSEITNIMDELARNICKKASK